MEVKKSMLKIASGSSYHKPDFILAIGDNFYEHGVSSIDDPLWDRYFKNLFVEPEFNVKW